MSETPTPKPAPPEPCCGNCNAFLPKTTGQHALCRARPPLVVFGGSVQPGLQRAMVLTTTRFPEVEPEWWCREHEPAKTTAEPT